MTNPYGVDPNSRGLGGTLAGIAQLISGLNQFRDPDADQRNKLQELLLTNPKLRDQYQAQFADNPEALQAILGRKPIFGSRSYNKTAALITGGQLSPEAIRDKSINTLQAKRDINTNISDIADASKRVPELNSYSSATIDRAAGKEFTPEERTKLEEYDALGRFQTPDERKLATTRINEGEANIKQSEAAIASSNATREEALTRNNILKEEANRKKEMRKAASDAIVRLGPRANLYTAWSEGKLSAPERNAIIQDDDYKDRYNKDFDEHFKQLDNDRQEKVTNANIKTIKQQRVGTYAEHLMEKARDLGIAVKWDDAVSIAENGDDSTADPKLKAINDAIKAKVEKADIAKYKANILKEVASVYTQMDKPGAEISDETLTRLNNASITNTPYPLDPVIYGIKETPGKHFWSSSTKTIVPISGDPKLINSIGLGKLNTDSKSSVQLQSKPAGKPDTTSKKDTTTTKNTNQQDEEVSYGGKSYSANAIAKQIIDQGGKIEDLDKYISNMDNRERQKIANAFNRLKK